MNVRDYLKRTPIFEGISPENLELVSSFSKLVKFPRKTLIFSEGEKAKGFYAVVEGKVAVFKTSYEGKEQILHIVEPPHTFAEAAVFGGNEYPASCRTLTDTTLVFVPKKELLSALKENHELSLQILRSLSIWLRRMVDLVEDLTLRDVEERFIKFLKETAEKEGIPPGDGQVIRFDVEKSVIASKIHAAPETFSRMLKRMTEKGLIEVKGPQIKVLDWSIFEEVE